jgi:signal transduction histidine kinase
MTAPQEHAEADLNRMVADRAADLAELLGHVNAAWDDERRLLARKLHDTLGSSLTALTMHLHLLSKHLPAEEAVQARSANMKQLLNNIIVANREMQLNLWNDKLEFLGIKAALAELVASCGEDGVMAAHLSLPDEDSTCTRPQAVALLRCAEEGLRNVRAHARASAVDVVLDENEDEIMLTVKDNGVGPGTAGPMCHGLRLLRERAAYLGGTLSIAPGTPGTVLTMVLPRASGEA